MTRPLLLVAASGLAREVLAAVSGVAGIDVRGLLDDAPELLGTSVGGLPVLGTTDSAADHPDADLLLCVGSGRSRAAIAERLSARGIGPDRFATIIHRSVHVPAGCTVGAGSILLAGVVLTADVSIGRHVVVMPHCTLTHDDVLEDFATLAAGATLGGGARIGRAAYIGMNAGVRERVQVGAGATVGMGAVVLQDVPHDEVWAGVPASRLRAGPGHESGSGRATTGPYQAGAARTSAVDDDGMVE